MSNARRALGWQKAKLGDFFRIKHGYAFKSRYFDASGRYIVLTPGNFRPTGGIQLRGDKEKHYTGEFPREFLLRRGDLLVVMTDLTQSAPLLGSPAFIPEDSKFLHNQRLGKIVELKDDVDRLFLYHLFNSSGVRQQIKASATGATVRHTAPERIYAVVVQIPPVETQRKIAAVLSAYDDLIENNLRRIEILEVMAEAIYREWFVKFRFPGHEKVKMVDSPLGKIPEGWEVLKVSDAFDILGGGTPSKKVDEYWSGGDIMWYVPSDLTAAGTMFMERSSNQITGLGLEKSSARVFPSYSVMMTSRATLGVVAINTTRACTNQGFITCLPNERVPLYYLYSWLLDNTDTFLNMASGATFKEISKRVFKTIDLLLPSEPVALRFQEMLERLADQALNLQRRNDNLRQTRDLLLPRLISGELNVSGLDIIATKD